MKLLYIEDDVDDLECFCEAVTRYGSQHECHTASDGPTGLEMLEAIDTPDFIFIDVRLPGMTGKEVLMVLRRMAQFKTVPIIMTSTTMRPADVQDLLLSGATRCMVKPDHPEDLFHQLQAIIDSPGTLAPM